MCIRVDQSRVGASRAVPEYPKVPGSEEMLTFEENVKRQNKENRGYKDVESLRRRKTRRTTRDNQHPEDETQRHGDTESGTRRTTRDKRQLPTTFTPP